MRIRDILLGFWEALIFAAFCAVIFYGLPILDFILNTESMK